MNNQHHVRQHEEKSFTATDRTQLFYRYWPASTQQPKGALVLFHRGHEHSGRMQHVVQELSLPEYACFAWDARGHGHSPGERGYSPSLSTSVRDIDNFIHHISSVYSISIENIVVIAQSVGAVLVSTWVHDYAPNIRGMVLASPAFKVKLYVPFARSFLKLRQCIQGNFFVNSYVKAKFLTHDPERIASYQADPLISRPIASHILLSLYDTADRIVSDAAAIVVPTQLLVSGSDFVVHQQPQQQFYENLGSTTKEIHVFEGFYHDTLGELDRGQAIDKARNFINQLFAHPITKPDLTQADKTGFTQLESEQLAAPLTPYSIRGIYWSLTRLGLKIGGWFSKGIKLGHQTGFDSGSTLDYVYENKPRGFSFLGRFFDKCYLNSIGWRGIRQRKINIETLIQKASTLLRQDNKPVHIMDIAAGHGRYVLEAIEKSQHKPDSILLRDYSPLNVEQGGALIKTKKLESIAKFVKADAFSLDSYQQLETKPTVGVVSGLYELFKENHLIQTSLQGFAQSIEPGGYLIYTGQPWHPQLEMIARALTSHRQGQAWVMRRRTQAELDQLVEQAGFKKVDQLIDEYGIFTVSLAQRIQN
jgi:alpha-beta hydrolase superfamily lysophospholipase